MQDRGREEEKMGEKVIGSSRVRRGFDKQTFLLFLLRDARVCQKQSNILLVRTDAACQKGGKKKRKKATPFSGEV